MDELKIDQEFFEAFKKVLLALKDYNQEIVIIGGFANALYEYHEYGQDSMLGVLATKDLDILTSDRVTTVNKTILESLKDQGFIVDPKPIEDKVITKFSLPESNFEIEFLCPKYGGDTDREGNEQLVKEIQEGVIAQPLRYLDIALFNPWIVDTKNVPGLNDIDMKIQIPNPGAYLIQKFIIKDRRKAIYAQKDCFYIYELLLKFRDHIDELKSCIDNILVMNSKKRRYHKVKNFKENFIDYFSYAEADGIVRCHDELRDRGYDSIGVEDIVAMFDLFIGELK